MANPGAAKKCTDCIQSDSDDSDVECLGTPEKVVISLLDDSQ